MVRRQPESHARFFRARFPLLPHVLNFPPKRYGPRRCTLTSEYACSPRELYRPQDLDDGKLLSKVSQDPMSGDAVSPARSQAIAQASLSEQRFSNQLTIISNLCMNALRGTVCSTKKSPPTWESAGEFTEIAIGQTTDRGPTIAEGPSE
jgi:hypothetical protein